MLARICGLRGFVERLLNSIKKCSMGFGDQFFVASEVGIEHAS